MEKIEFYQRLQFFCRADDFSKLIMGFDKVLWYGFTIDCANHKIIPDSSNYDYASVESDCEIFNNACDNVLKEELTLDVDKLNNFLDEFKKLEFKDSNHYGLFEKTFSNSVSVTDSDGLTREYYGNYSKNWLKLGELLKELVGFDILNIEASKYLITDLYYDIKPDGFYDKITKQKLKLKYLIFSHSPVLNIVNIPMTIIDFENRLIRGSIFKNDFSDESLNQILELLEKYHIYELEDKKYWQKDTNHRRWVLDGYRWSLSLVFEDNIHWRIGTANEYPDIFVHMAEELIQLTGEDILNLKLISETQRELYREYGDKILGKY